MANLIKTAVAITGEVLSLVAVITVIALYAGIASLAFTPLT